MVRVELWYDNGDEGSGHQAKNEEQISKKDERELTSASTGSCQSDNNCVTIKPSVYVM